MTGNGAKFSRKMEKAVAARCNGFSYFGASNQTEAVLVPKMPCFVRVGLTGTSPL
jgi:hypothetical protein